MHPHTRTGKKDWWRVEVLATAATEGCSTAVEGRTEKSNSNDRCRALADKRSLRTRARACSRMHARAQVRPRASEDCIRLLPQRMVPLHADAAWCQCSAAGCFRLKTAAVAAVRLPLDSKCRCASACPRARACAACACTRTAARARSHEAPARARGQSRHDYAHNHQMHLLPHACPRPLAANAAALILSRARVPHGRGRVHTRAANANTCFRVWPLHARAAHRRCQLACGGGITC